MWWLLMFLLTSTCLKIFCIKLISFDFIWVSFSRIGIETKILASKTKMFFFQAPSFHHFCVYTTVRMISKSGNANNDEGESASCVYPSDHQDISIETLSRTSCQISCPALILINISQLKLAKTFLRENLCKWLVKENYFSRILNIY